MLNLLPILDIGDVFPGCFVFFIIAGVIALVVWSARHQKKIREAWLTFARNHKLQVQGAANRPTIQGWYGPTWIMLNTVVRGSGKNRTTYTQHHATINAPMPAGIVLYKEGFFSKIGKTFGGQDVQTGDRQLDDAFIIKGQDLLGIHDLLNLPAVKQALLYVVARHPGIRIDGKRILVEHTGMSGDLPKLEGIFSDLSYLVQTFDAAYQELLARKGGAPEPKRRAKSNRQAPVSSKAAAAEILGAEFFDKQVRRGETQVRQAAADEDPAQRAAAFSQMADVLHQYEDKLQRGEVTPETRKSADVLHEYSPGEAFTNRDTSDVLGASNTSGRSALDAYDPTNVWHSRRESDNVADAFKTPEAGDAFADPTPVETAPESKPAPEPAKKDAPLEVGINFDALLARLSDSSLLSSDREKLIAENRGKTWEMELLVDRVDSTWGFDTPDALKDGKTVEAKLKGTETRVAMRFPKDRNDEIGKLRSGESLTAWGILTGWDDLFKKATMDAE